MQHITKEPVTEVNPIFINKRCPTREDTGKRTLKEVQLVGQAIVNVTTKDSFFARFKPCIAGGSIRDITFGLRCKDVDVFFDVSALEEDENIEDICLLLSAALQKEMDENFVNEEFVIGGRPLPNQLRIPDSLSGPYGDTSSFCVYELLPYYFVKEGNFEKLVRVQVIAVNNPTLSSSPLEYVEKEFDYPAVKCYYDPYNQTFNYSNEFFDFISNPEKEYVVSNKDSCPRFAGFLGNFLNSGITVKDNSPKEEEKKTIPISLQDYIQMFTRQG